MLWHPAHPVPATIRSDKLRGPEIIDPDPEETNDLLAAAGLPSHVCERKPIRSRLCVIAVHPRDDIKFGDVKANDLETAA